MLRLLLLATFAFSALLLLPNTEVSAQEQDYFYFPMDEGNIWVYKSDRVPDCMEIDSYRGCTFLRMEIVQTDVSDTRTCAVFSYEYLYVMYKNTDDNNSTSQEPRQFQLCQVENRIYQIFEETDIDSSLTYEFMVADFDRDYTEPWVIAVFDPSPYQLRRKIELDFAGPDDFLFKSYLANNKDDLYPTYANKWVNSDPMQFRDGVGFFKYGNLFIRGHVIKGELSGDTTFVHAVSVEFSDDTPYQIQLDAYPNPFNPAATINIHLPAASHTSLKVYDLLGRQVGILNSTVLPAGPHRFTFDATHLPGGIYIVKLRTENETAIRKITLLK